MAKVKLLKCNYYVSMTDKFFSGWGPAKGKKARFIYCCNTLPEARIVAENARHRGDQKNIVISSRAPSIKFGTVYQFVTKLQAPRWYKEGGFPPKKKGRR